MTSTNGVASPQSQLDHANSSVYLSAKRKREDSNEAAVHMNGILDTNSTVSPQRSYHDAQQQISDFLEVLKRCVDDPVAFEECPMRRSSFHQYLAILVELVLLY